MNERRLPSLRTIPVIGAFALLVLLFTAEAARAQALSTNVGSDLGAFSTGELQHGLVATGGNGTYTWDVTAGSLPPGVALRTDKPFWFPPNVSAGLFGVPTVPGRYTFTLRVRSAGAADLSIPTAMTITPLNVNEPFDLPDGLTNTAYSYTLTPLNNPGAVTWALVNGSLPPGLGLSAGGTISGSPTAAGLFNFTYSLNDGTNTIYRGANIRVTTVKITSTILANATQNLPYGPVAIEASGGTGAYTFTQDGGILFTSAPIDSTAPLVTATAPGMLWPPSGRTVPVQVRGTIRDAGSGVNLSSARFAVTDEYATVHPSGEVTVSADGNFTVNVPLVAARHEADADGRKYTIVISAKDTAGNEGSTTVIVVVPHDQGK